MRSSIFSSHLLHLLNGLEMNAPNRDVTSTNEKSRGRKCMEGRCPQHPGVHLFLTRIECTVADMWCTTTAAKVPERHLSRDRTPAQLNSSGTTNTECNGGSAEDRKIKHSQKSQKSRGDRRLYADGTLRSLFTYKKAVNAVKSRAHGDV
ncbi:hypothetical protein T12_12108 [Trichinella patagoniensis]|uniref:Uncharacterized protein n=1 Tax=Trichinella patagoniensis TaxID=990121 RepID=A0A0V1AES1_9BILA|nr:hypothetical protein T12_12108 [Trichinella patagoniensis]